MDVFISYQHDSKEIADRVVNYLEKRGLTCWYAPRDMEAGDYSVSIVKAIKNCKVFVLILTQEVSNSGYVLDEIEAVYERVIKREVAFIPLKSEDADFSDELLFKIKRFHWVDGTTADNGVAALYLMIAKALNLTAKRISKPSNAQNQELSKSASNTILDKSSTADENPTDAEEQCNLGECYYNGDGVEEDLDKAVYWFKKSAEQGYARAQCYLGECYDWGNGVEPDEEKSQYWYAKAAMQGYAEAQYNLGLGYSLGSGIEEDKEKAVYWYTKAAEQGYYLAQNDLGDCYYDGDGVKKDYKKAAYWYTKAVEASEEDDDYDIPMYNLGKCYYFGNGVKKDREKAKELWQKSAEKGFSLAKNALEKYFGIII